MFLTFAQFIKLYPEYENDKYLKGISSLHEWSGVIACGIVKDANNNPVSGVSVTFAPATGSGSLASSGTVTLRQPFSCRARQLTEMCVLCLRPDFGQVIRRFCNHV